jgi:hypothetical protein
MELLYSGYLYHSNRHSIFLKRRNVQVGPSLDLCRFAFHCFSLQPFGFISSSVVLCPLHKSNACSSASLCRFPRHRRRRRLGATLQGTRSFRFRSQSWITTVVVALIPSHPKAPASSSPFFSRSLSSVWLSVSCLMASLSFLSLLVFCPLVSAFPAVTMVVTPKVLSPSISANSLVYPHGELALLLVKPLGRLSLV